MMYGIAPEELPNRHHPAHGVRINPIERTIVFVTICTKHRKPWLATSETHQQLYAIWTDATAWRVGWYVLMPDHVHLLIYPREESYSISNILLAIKRPVARQALLYVRRIAPSFLGRMRDLQPNGRVAHRFWQRGGGYDRNLIDAKTVRKTIDYIHGNPLRRGLVESPEDWYWSSAGHFVDGRLVPLLPDSDSIPPFDGGG
ncbi:MAG: transposase [Planctomycetes bacterium]|nr:transposase [Planctomycetota bacterium]